MNDNEKDMTIHDEVVMNKIYLLKQQVKRNLNRFPEHFMFELTKDENESLRSQNVTLKRGEHSKYLPYVFTEHRYIDVIQCSKKCKRCQSQHSNY